MNQTFSFTMLSMQEAESINGGAERELVESVFYAVGFAARSIWEYSKSAMEYQSSLPANLKK